MFFKRKVIVDRIPEAYLPLLDEKQLLTVCVPTLFRYDMLKRLVLSLENGSMLPRRYIVIDNGAYKTGGIFNYIVNDPEFALYLHKISIVPSTCNLGVSASWNKFFGYTTDERILISNDDIEFDKDTLKELLYFIAMHPSACFVSPSGANIFSCFIMRRYLFNRVGTFDERFYPAYMEDNDYSYRMALAGFNKDVHIVESAKVGHFGSASSENLADSYMSWRDSVVHKNKLYYVSKWGGLPGKEKFRRAFNIQEPKI